MNAFYKAIIYLDAHNCGGRYGVLKNSKTTYVIKINNDGNNNFDNTNGNGHVINWDPSLGLEKDGKVVMSPAAILNHEMAHATIYDKALEQYYEDYKNLGSKQAEENFYKNYTSKIKKDSENPYTTQNEQYIIQGIEQRTAIMCAEIQPGEVTRTDHTGSLVPVNSPISTKKVNAINE